MVSVLNQIQTLKECLSCHMYCAQLWPRVAAIVTVSCAVSNRESQYTPVVHCNLDLLEIKIDLPIGFPINNIISHLDLS